MIYQLNGRYLNIEEQCEYHGDSDWQIVMHYFRILNGE